MKGEPCACEGCPGTRAWDDWPPLCSACGAILDVARGQRLICSLHGTEVHQGGVKLGEPIPRARNLHDGDAYKIFCEVDGHNHWIVPARAEGCNYGVQGKGKVANQFQVHLLVLRDGARCYACHYVPKDHREHPWKDRHLEVQHIRPRKDGGSNCLHNLVFLCHPCHVRLAKGRKYGGIPVNLLAFVPKLEEVSVP